ncbi:hypothetical protein [Virgibacillus ndiopensis]|nr:hypothetical protein [Virgibacillus ndiopensis]
MNIGSRAGISAGEREHRQESRNIGRGARIAAAPEIVVYTGCGNNSYIR